MLILAFVLSALSAAGSLYAVWRSSSTARALESLDARTARLAGLEESVVRSVMEEGGETSAAAVIKVAQNLREMGLFPSDAVRQARSIVKRKVDP